MCNPKFQSSLKYRAPTRWFSTWNSRNLLKKQLNWKIDHFLRSWKLYWDMQTLLFEKNQQFKSLLPHLWLPSQQRRTCYALSSGILKGRQTGKPCIKYTLGHSIAVGHGLRNTVRTINDVINGRFTIILR